MVIVAAACSVISSSAPAKPQAAVQVQATINALQGTIDAMQKSGAATADAWMTESAPPPGQPNPGGQPQQPTEAVGMGTIIGKLSFPTESIPPIRVVAFNINTGEYFVTEMTDKGTYSLEVPAGQYQVVAYPIQPSNSNLSGGYSQAVPCGLSINCTDHSLIAFEVKPGEQVQSIDPGDWTAPPGSFPPDPTIRK